MFRIAFSIVPCHGKIKILKKTVNTVSLAKRCIMKRRQLFILIFSLVFFLTCSLSYTFNKNTKDEAILRKSDSKNHIYEDVSESETEDISEIYPEFESEDISEIYPEFESETISEIYSEFESFNSNYPISERITYHDNFYYEPLSDDIINRIYGISYREDCPIPYEELRYVKVLHYDFYGSIVSGELICNKTIAQDIVEIFYSLYEAEYPIEKMVLIDEYMADDKLSMIDNNTSCFNYRTVEGTTKISKHGLGMAIDINPFYNPYVSTNSDGSLYVSPPGSEAYANRNLDFNYKITENDICYKLFAAHGFKWGGNYKSIKDYQHFYME